MSTHDVQMLRRIREEGAYLPDSEWTELDEMILTASALDGELATVSAEDEDYFMEIGRGKGSYVYKASEELHADVGCYLSARYLSGLEAGEVDVSGDTALPWIESHIGGTCTVFNTGRLFAFMLGIRGGDDLRRPVFPERLILAGYDERRKWLRDGFGKLSTARLVSFLERYSGLPVARRRDLALDILEALRTRNSDRTRERIPGIAEVIDGIIAAEKDVDWLKPFREMAEIYAKQLKIASAFGNLTDGEGSSAPDFDALFSFKPETFIGRLIEYRGLLAVSGAGGSKVLIDSLDDRLFHPGDRAMAARALGDLAYSDDASRREGAQVLADLVEEALADCLDDETVAKGWLEGEEARILFEAIVALGKTGVVEVEQGSTLELLARAAYYPMFEGNPDLAWVNLAGMYAIVKLLPALSPPERKIAADTLVLDGLTHPSPVCRRFVLKQIPVISKVPNASAMVTED